jgi:hypothetical protein
VTVPNGRHRTGAGPVTVCIAAALVEHLSVVLNRRDPALGERAGSIIANDKAGCWPGDLLAPGAYPVTAAAPFTAILGDVP